jgi:methionyl-tRNA formyltransferase
MSKRVLLLTHDSREARWLAQTLADELNLVGIVLPERSPKPPRQLWRRRVYNSLGPQAYENLVRAWRVIRKPLLERKLEKLERGLKEEAEDWLFGQFGSVEPAWPTQIQRKSFARFNAPETHQWCSAQDPALIILFGTPIIRPKLIEIPTVGCLNLHGSLLPEYRGTRSEFFQVLNQSWDTVGYTLHFVDAKVDTGKIVRQEANPDAVGKDPYRIRAQNFLLARAGVSQAAQGVLDGSITGEPQPPGRSVTYRSRDITLERRAQVLRNLGLIS